MVLDLLSEMKEPNFISESLFVFRVEWFVDFRVLSREGSVRQLGYLVR